MADPRSPTRKEFAKAFNNDQRMIRAFEKLFDLIPDDINAGISILLDAQNSWIGPALSNLNSQIFEQSKDVKDLVSDIASDKSQIARISALVYERDKTIADHRELIASLLATVGTLGAQLAESTKPRTIRFVDAAYQILNNDGGIVADTSSGNFDITFPDPEKNTGKEYPIQNAGSGNYVAIPFGSELFGGEAEITVRSGTPFPSVNFKSDGTNWIVT